MRKKIIFRSLTGAPLGLAIGYILTIISSVNVKDGNFYPVPPQLIEHFDREIHAVILQAVMMMLYGAFWAGASVIWEMEDWSLFRMTATHLILTSVITFPIAWFMHWMPHSISGILLYYGIFILIYALIWIGIYIPTRKKIMKINEQLQK